MIWDEIWDEIWYDMIWDMIWYDMRFDPIRWDEMMQLHSPSLPQPHHAVIHNCDLCFYFHATYSLYHPFIWFVHPHSLSDSISHSLTHSLSPSLIHSLCHSLTHSTPTHSLTHLLTHSLSHTHLLTYSINHCSTFLFSLSSTNSRGGGGGVDFLGCMPINLSRRNLMNVQRYAR